MAQAKSKFWLWFVLGSSVVGAVIYNQSAPSNSSPLKATKSSSSSKSSTSEIYTKDDYSAHFARLDLAPTDIFKPLVTMGTNAAALGSNNFDIPTDMTKGEPNWAFTGTASINNAHMALFENSKTLQGDYVKVGQSWKSCIVQAISGDSVVLRSVAGTVKTVQMTADLQAIAEQSKLNSAPPALVPPVNPGTPPLTGQIGGGGPGGPGAQSADTSGQNGMAVAGSGDTSTVTIEAAPSNTGRRRGNFNRRNRGNAGQ